MSSASTKLITAEEYFRMPDPDDGTKQELLRGEIVTMSQPGFEHGLIQVALTLLLGTFLKAKPIGRITVESGVQTASSPDTVRGPDVAFWSFERIPADQRPKAFPDVVPDLCVEVRSPGQSRPELAEKAAEYLRAGVRLVWVVDPKDRSVTVYRPGAEPTQLTEAATLDGADVLPDFACLVSELFE